MQLITLTGYQIRTILDMVDAEDEAEITISYIDYDRPCVDSGEVMPAGLYAWFTDYPDEGSLYLPEADDGFLRWGHV